MKLIILLNDFRPFLKCGSLPGEQFASTLLGGTFDMVNTERVNEQQEDNLKRQLAAQREENALNRDWQTVEAEKARQFTTSERLAQQSYQTGVLSRQQEYNKENLALQAQYNSPVYQSQELQKAGLNPAVYYGQQASFAGSSLPSLPSGGSVPSGAQSPMPSGVHGLNPLPYNPSTFQIGGFINSIGSALKSMAEARKIGVETGMLPEEIAAKIRSLNTQSDLSTVMKVAQEYANWMHEAKLPYRYKMAALDVEKAVADLELTNENKYTQQSVQRVNDALVRLHDSQSSLNDKEREKLGVEVMMLPNLLKSQINANIASAEQSYASASESRASAEQIQLFNRIYKDERFKHSVISQCVSASQQAIEAGRLTKNQADHMNYLVQQAAYATDMQEFTYWSNQVNQFVNTIGQTASQFYGAGALRELIRLRQGQQVSPAPVRGFTP